MTATNHSAQTRQLQTLLAGGMHPIIQGAKLTGAKTAGSMIQLHQAATQQIAAGGMKTPITAQISLISAGVIIL